MASTSQAQEKWQIAIRPLTTDSIAAVAGDEQGETKPTPASPAPAASGTFAPRMTYEQAYNMVPFSRAEYEANPSYRHDSAIEIMTGQLRPTVIMRHNIPYFSRYPDLFRYKNTVFPYMGGVGPNSSDVYMHYQTSVIAY